MRRKKGGAKMTFFKDYTFHWWQFSLLKISMLALGMLAGSYWHEYFQNGGMITLLWAVFVLPSVYLAAVTFKKMGSAE